MSGLRLIIGAIVMGAIVPMTLFYLLPLASLSQLFTLSVVCFFAWCIADFSASVLSRPRLHNRSPQSALRDWEEQQKSGAVGSDPSDTAVDEGKG